MGCPLQERSCSLTMDPEYALFLVCRLAYRLRFGTERDLLPIDEPLLHEIVMISYLDYRPSLVVREDFRLLVDHHYGQLGICTNFLTPTKLEWMLMFFEKLIIGEINLSPS